MSTSIFSRLASNKENTSLPLISSISHPIRASTILATNRAKLASPYARPLSSPKKASTRAKRPMSLSLSPQKRPSVKVPARERKGESVTSTQSAPEVGAGGTATGKTFIPLRLPRVKVVPVELEKLGEELSAIPLEFILHQLSTHSPQLLITSSLYHPTPLPLPSHSSPTPPGTLRFHLTPPLPGQPQGTAGFEPDTCLAVRPTRLGVKNARGEGEEVGRLMAVHRLVYASKCSLFPNPTTEIEHDSATSLSNSTSSSSTARSTSSTSTIVGTLIASLAMKDLSSAVKLEDGSPSSPSYDGDGDDILGDLKATELRTQLDLPIIHLSLPYPSLLPLLHTYLHSPSPAYLLSQLLSLPPLPPLPSPSSPATPGIKDRLRTLPASELLKRLKVVHALWSDVVALGVGEEGVWRVMERGWEVLVGALGEVGGRG